MAMLYAADEKSDKNALNAAKFAAYLENKAMPKVEPKVELKVKPKVEAKVEPKVEIKTQSSNELLKPTGIKLFADNIGADDIENHSNPEKRFVLKASDSNTSLKSNFKPYVKTKKTDIYGLSGDDLQIPFEDRSILADYKKQYEKAEEELDYMKMNRIHKKAAKFRQQYYGYKDDYDYTHGGMYDIYTNFDDSDESYDKNGHYEQVYKIDGSALLEFCEDIDKAYAGSKGETPSVAEDILSLAPAVISKVLESKIPESIAKGSTAFSIYYALLKFMYNDIRRKSDVALEASTTYGKSIASKEWNNNVDYYVYLLDGGFSSELKIRAIDKNDVTILAEGNFDLKQREVLNAFMASAEENGELKSVNRRFWKYSYVS